MMREIAGEYILIPVGEAAVQFQGMMTLNGSGLFLWRQLQEERTEEELLAAMLAEYEIDAETARADIAKFLDQLKATRILLE